MKQKCFVQLVANAPIKMKLRAKHDYKWLFETKDRYAIVVNASDFLLQNNTAHNEGDDTD